MSTRTRTGFSRNLLICWRFDHQSVMVVGDDAQSIYSWRGANYQNILDFPKRYPNAKIYRIETNYRSVPEILALANAAIQANTKQFSKTLRAHRNGSEIKPALVSLFDNNQQAAFVAQRVLELRDEGIDLDTMAVLYRAHFHSLEVQLALTRSGIPFAITSGLRFFEQAHIKDIAAFMKFAINPADEVAFKRIAAPASRVSQSRRPRNFGISSLRRRNLNAAISRPGWVIAALDRNRPKPGNSSATRSMRSPPDDSRFRPHR